MRKADQEKLDKIKRIRERLNEINELHLTTINEQFEITQNALRGYLDRKSQILSDYIKELRTFSTDDVGQALLDNLSDIIKDIRSEMVKILEDVQNFDADSDLDQSNFISNRIEELLSLINRLQDIETILQTHIGESGTDEN